MNILKAFNNIQFLKLAVVGLVLLFGISACDLENRNGNIQLPVLKASRVIQKIPVYGRFEENPEWSVDVGKDVVSVLQFGNQLIVMSNPVLAHLDKVFEREKSGESVEDIAKREGINSLKVYDLDGDFVYGLNKENFSNFIGSYSDFDISFQVMNNNNVIALVSKYEGVEPNRKHHSKVVIFDRAGREIKSFEVEGNAVLLGSSFIEISYDRSFFVITDSSKSGAGSYAVFDEFGNQVDLKNETIGTLPKLGGGTATVKIWDLEKNGITYKIRRSLDPHVAVNAIKAEQIVWFRNDLFIWDSIGLKDNKGRVIADSPKSCDGIGAYQPPVISPNGKWVAHGQAIASIPDRNGANAYVKCADYSTLFQKDFSSSFSVIDNKGEAFANMRSNDESSKGKKYLVQYNSNPNAGKQVEFFVSDDPKIGEPVGISGDLVINFSKEMHIMTANKLKDTYSPDRLPVSH